MVMQIKLMLLLLLLVEVCLIILQFLSLTKMLYFFHTHIYTWPLESITEVLPGGNWNDVQVYTGVNHVSLCTDITHVWVSKPPPPPLNNPCLHELPCNFDLQAWVFRLALKRTCGHYKNLVPDPDLETRGARSSRPLDKRGGGVGETAVSINFISALRASVWSKNKGASALPGPSPPPPWDPPLEFHSHLNTNSIDNYLISTP